MALSRVPDMSILRIANSSRNQRMKYQILYAYIGKRTARAYLCWPINFQTRMSACAFRFWLQPKRWCARGSTMWRAEFRIINMSIMPNNRSGAPVAAMVVYGQINATIYCALDFIVCHRHIHSMWLRRFELVIGCLCIAFIIIYPMIFIASTISYTHYASFAASHFFFCVSFCHRRLRFRFSCFPVIRMSSPIHCVRCGSACDRTFS